jgi:(1->4)-alpha-D-glucan 1-alpha-D-glucosylmutase
MAALAPYLRELGISHVYASPYLRARQHSEHGYDITDHNALNLELGDCHAFQEMIRTFREHGLEQILDYVPNHMGVGGSDNPLWLDVLEWGQQSKYSSWFDIDWDSHSRYLSGKLLVPFLAEHYGTELEAGKIELQFDPAHGEFSVWLYGTHRLPVAPPSYPEILGNETGELAALARDFASLPVQDADLYSRVAELKSRLAQCAASEPARHAIETRLARFGGASGNLESWSALDALIRKQHWRPTHFRVAADDINYRRFFNISELAGIRMELPEVFDHSHRLVFDLLREGNLQGLRIDHVDGLFDPKGYLNRLRTGAGVPFYLIVEKIIESHEDLRSDWPVEGTTGYEFCSQVTELLVDHTAEKKLTDFYREFTGERKSFSQIVHESKLRIMENEMASELEALARAAVRIAQQDPMTQDFTHNILRRALKEIYACFPVYRTYVDSSAIQETDVRYIHWAVAQAKKNEQELDPSVFEFLENLLKGCLAPHGSSGPSAQSVTRFAMKAQQFSGPVMAKGLEDTALYRYSRFVALNEVGSSPDEFGITLATFHKENQKRAEKWPHTLLATSTHDTKRGEDARARLAALSLVSEEWTTKVASWSRILRARRGDVEGTAPPARDDEYLFFQNLIATWPAELTQPAELQQSLLAQYSERLVQATIKFLREARIRSNWTAPESTYEDAVAQFVKDALNSETSQTFLENFLAFQQNVAKMGVHNSLVQLTLKVTSPGVPDFYQGSELWDLNLTDPDNRRPVDFAKRSQLLKQLRDEASAEPPSSILKRHWENWHDGAIKLAVLSSLLTFRAANEPLFSTGRYEPLFLADEYEGRVCSFWRTTDEQIGLIVASLDARLQSTDYRHQKLSLGGQSSHLHWREVISERDLAAREGTLTLSEVFESLPVALLVPAPNS